MMNDIFAALILISAVWSIAAGRQPEAAEAILQSGSDVMRLMLTVTGAMALWSGILAIAEKSGLTGAAAVLLRPLLRRIMPGLARGGDAEKYICMNVVANVFGLGNAATPPGLKAMRALAGENHLPGQQPTREMVTFAVLNTASVQLIPTTVMSLRGAVGSKDPAGILVCVWISSLSALAAGLLMCLALSGGKKEVRG